ncbi:MAG: aldo/keto reductase [Clostridia bacterium]|nr:aldo/keto reductase [Clostridia bacterium]
MNFKLNNGVEIPDVGLGTWLIDNDKVADVIKNAVSVGYRHIDTAQAYENEEGVGIGIKSCGVDRKDIFVTSKVRAEYKDYDTAKKSIDESLKKLGLDYIDLMIIHCPQPWNEYKVSDNHYYKENREVWRALEDAYNEGKLKAIGVSNFYIDDLKNILESCKIKPMINQILTHVGQTPFETIDFCKNEGIVVEAYSPIAHGEADRIETVQVMAKKYNKSFAQICIKYCLNLGLVALPKARSIEHLRDNFDLDFEISDDDMEVLKGNKPLSDYGKADFFPVFKQSDK